jgi:hypothetical protein
MPTTTCAPTRTTATVAALLAAGLAVLTGACATPTPVRDPSAGAGTQTGTSSVSASVSADRAASLPTWAASGTRVHDITVADGTTATAAVGDWVHFEGPREVTMSVVPASLDVATYYGTESDLLMLHAGTVQIAFPNFDKHFDCPNGPCAHPNAPLHMTLTVTGGGSAPDIPDPVRLTDLTADATVHLVPGQRLRLPAGADGSAYPADPSTMWWSAGDDPELVAFAPGTARWGLHPDARTNSGDEVTVTVIVDRP